VDFGRNVYLGVRHQTPHQILSICSKLISSHSVAELNAGIICSCMPIVFVTFKGFSTRISKITWLRYFRSITNSSTEKNAQLAGPAVENVEIEIPKPVMTGVRSFIQRNFRSNPTRGDTTHTESYVDLESMSDEYHTQLYPQAFRKIRSASDF